jgi:hypothetical protein
VIAFYQTESFTLTECGGGVDLFDFTIGAMTIVFPILIFVCFWKIFITDKSPRVVSLGLKETNSPFEPLATKQIGSGLLLLYFLVSVSTFALGVFAFKVFNLIRDALAVQ